MINLDIHTKVVGTTFTGWQHRFNELSEGQTLLLKRDFANKFDINAVGVHTQKGERIGYIKAELARDVALALDSGVEFKCVITKITGGTEHYYESYGDNYEVDYDLHGCNIKIMRIDKSEI